MRENKRGNKETRERAEARAEAVTSIPGLGTLFLKGGWAEGFCLFNTRV